jgi:hypothetical protein
LGVGAGVGEIDRVPLGALAQRFARVEVPPEEAVDEQRDVAEQRSFVIADAAIVGGVPVVQRRRRVVANDAQLGAEP